MRAAAPAILLVGRNFTPGSQFQDRLCRNGCACTIAKNLDEARAIVRSREFEIVLSDIALPDGSAFPLLALLEGSPATLFFCVGVHDGCWWLPALDRGRRTWGEAALCPAEFAHVLDALLGAETPRTSDATLAASEDHASVIPMPPIEITPPKPERIQTQNAKARKSSA